MASPCHLLREIESGNTLAETLLAGCIPSCRTAAASSLKPSCDQPTPSSHPGRERLVQPLRGGSVSPVVQCQLFGLMAAAGRPATHDRPVFCRTESPVSPAAWSSHAPPTKLSLRIGAIRRLNHG